MKVLAPLMTVHSPRAGAQRFQVRTTARFGQGNSREHFPARKLAKPTGLLLLSAIINDVVGGNRMYACGCR
jgi:hypothetical protein